MGVAGCSGGEGTGDGTGERRSGSDKFSESWTTYRAGFDRRGRTANSAPSGSPTIRGVFEPDVSVQFPKVSTPVLTPERIFYQVDGRVLALDRESLDLDWERDLVGGTGLGVLSVVDGTLFAWRHSIDASTGSVNWEFDGSRWGWGSIVTDSHLYVNGGSVVDRQTGELLEEDSHSAFIPTPAYEDGIVYYDNQYGALVAYDVEAQDAVWSGPAGMDSSESGATPAVGDRNVYHIIGGTLFAFDKTGEVQWSWSVNEYGPPVLVGGDSVFASAPSARGSLVLDPASGERQGTLERRGSIIQTPSKIVGATKESAWAVSNDDHADQWEIGLTRDVGSETFHSPVVADGELYMAFNSGALAAFA